MCFPLPPSPVYLWKGKYAESEAQHGVTEPGEVKWVEGGFRLCAPLCWEFLCCPHHPQLDLSAPLCESALSSNMLSLFLPQDLCTRSAFCQEHFFLSSPEGCFFPPLNSGLSLNTTFTERLFLAMISVIDPSSHSLSHHPYFLKLSRS